MNSRQRRKLKRRALKEIKTDGVTFYRGRMWVRGEAEVGVLFFSEIRDPSSWSGDTTHNEGIHKP